MGQFYCASQRALQDEFESRRLADRLDEVIVKDRLDEDAQKRIGSADFFFLSTVDEEGFPSVSYKGGCPGFVHVIDEQTLQFPCFDGNGMWLSAGNIEATGKVGLLFIDFETPGRLRLQGHVKLRRDEEVTRKWPEVGLVVEVNVRRVWPNCPRYIHRMTRAEDAIHVPKAGVETPVPSWKSWEAFADVVPPSPHVVVRSKRSNGSDGEPA